jgi:hypothetical protein
MADARQWQHGRRGSGCGELPAMLGHQVLLEAHVWAREELRVMGWSRAQASKRAHRRRNGGQRRLAWARVGKRRRGFL